MHPEDINLLTPDWEGSWFLDFSWSAASLIFFYLTIWGCIWIKGISTFTFPTQGIAGAKVDQKVQSLEASEWELKELGMLGCGGQPGCPNPRLQVNSGCESTFRLSPSSRLDFSSPTVQSWGAGRQPEAGNWAVGFFSLLESRNKFLGFPIINIGGAWSFSQVGPRVIWKHSAHACMHLYTDPPQNYSFTPKGRQEILLLTPT